MFEQFEDSLTSCLGYLPKKESEVATIEMQQTLQVPVCLEVMPTAEYWCSSYDTLIGFLLFLNVSHVVSHVNIWHWGNEMVVKETCLNLLDSFTVGVIHLSHNKGKADTHDLILQSVWFNNYLEEWRDRYLVTYESLPVDYAIYERLDKCRKFAL